mmetsp:Transcript_97113/g.271829  ORF Transcript_97113/g.271829 Transcript_97113/m.271829 type:complete len:496 (+) Transcript_97113:221-1708(+)
MRRSESGSPTMHLHLWAGLYNKEVALKVYHPLYVLRGAHDLLDAESHACDLRQELSTRDDVTHQRLARVVDRSRHHALAHNNAVVEASPGEALEVFRVGIRAEYEGRAVDKEPHALAWETSHRKLRYVCFGRATAQRSSCVVTHERLPQAAHDFGVQLLVVAGRRVRCVKHKGIARLHHLLAEDGHGDRRVVQSRFPATQVGSVVPLRRPDAGDGGPSVGPPLGHPGISGPRQALVAESLTQCGDRIRSRHQPRHHLPDLGQQGRRIGGTSAQVCREFAETLCNTGVLLCPYNCVERPIWQCYGRRKLDPIRELATQAVQIARLAPGDVQAEVRRYNGTSAQEARWLDGDNAELRLRFFERRRPGARAVSRCMARRHCHRIPTGGRTASHKRALHRTDTLQHSFVEHRGEEHPLVPGTHSDMGQDVGRVLCQQGHDALGDLFVASDGAGDEHRGLVVARELDMRERVHEHQPPRSVHRRDHLPSPKVGHGSKLGL